MMKKIVLVMLCALVCVNSNEAKAQKVQQAKARHIPTSVRTVESTQPAPVEKTYTIDPKGQTYKTQTTATTISTTGTLLTKRDPKPLAIAKPKPTPPPIEKQEEEKAEEVKDVQEVKQVVSRPISAKKPTPPPVEEEVPEEEISSTSKKPCDCNDMNRSYHSYRR